MDIEILNKKVIFVGGKGGVGKTTISSSIAINLSKSKKTLIISTDPAHSLGDALDVKLNDSPKKIHENLFAMELNSDKVLKNHFERIETILMQYTKPQMKEGVRKYLNQAKNSPGGQEAAILEAICEYLVDFENLGFEALVFDTAPTGHTLRLLTLPEMMASWSQGLLKRADEREKLKDAAEVFWKSDKYNFFSKQRTDRQMLAKKSLEKRLNLFKQAREILQQNSCGIVFVMIPEVLSFQETKRAISFLKDTKLPLLALVINQIIPKNQQEIFWQQRVKLQDEVLKQTYKTFNKIKIIEIKLQSQDLRGFDKLTNIFD